jgi:uncharacterized protein (DUF486 family)
MKERRDLFAAWSGVSMSLPMATIILLIISNVFMTLAWYGNLKFPQLPMLAAIFIGWGIALIEYSFAVPANRIGYAHGFSGGQLKIIQEIITLSVFAAFAAVVLKEPIGWRYVGAFACIAGAAAFMFVGRA